MNTPIKSVGEPKRLVTMIKQGFVWAPLATERSPPPGPAASWPRHAILPLTYHPVPDIA